MGADGIATAADMRNMLGAIKDYTERHDPKHPVLLFRLPHNELRSLASMHCPIDNSEAKVNSKTTDDNNKTIMNSSKRLRQFFKIKEASVCSTCPFSATCTERNLPAGFRDDKAPASTV